MIRWAVRSRVLFLASALLTAAAPLDSQGQVLFRPVLGGLPADSGLAAGFELLRYRTLGPFDARARIVGSLKKYEHVELSLESPPPATHDFFSEFRLRYRNYPQEDFWGLGPDSNEDRHSNYRLEDVWLTGTAGLHFRSGLRVAAFGGLVEVNAGPGTDKKYPSTEQQFTVAEATALEAAPDYWRGGIRLDYDRRDDRDDPRAGDVASFEWARFEDREPGDYSFHRYEFEYRRFLSLSDAGRIAGRARAVLTGKASGHEIPFFLQPSIGGTDTVRGFDQYRFRSGNALLFNIEYRRAMMGFLDAVAFVDAGSVTARPHDLSLNELRGTAGGGVRVRFGGRVFFGLDAGFSREGAHFWFRSGHSF